MHTYPTISQLVKANHKSAQIQEGGEVDFVPGRSSSTTLQRVGPQRAWFNRGHDKKKYSLIFVPTKLLFPVFLFPFFSWIIWSYCSIILKDMALKCWWESPCTGSGCVARQMHHWVTWLGLLFGESLLVKFPRTVFLSPRLEGSNLVTGVLCPESCEKAVCSMVLCLSHIPVPFQAPSVWSSLENNPAGFCQGR